MADLNDLIYQNVKDLPNIENASDVKSDDSLIVVQDVTTKKASFSFLTDYTVDSVLTSLPEWVKGTDKPEYTAAEVGADEAGSAQTALADAKAYVDAQLESVNEAIATNAASIKTVSDSVTTTASSTLNSAKSYTNTEITSLKGEVSEDMDTLAKIETAINSIETTITNVESTAKSYTDTQISTVNKTVAGKANASHTHKAANVTDFTASVDALIDKRGYLTAAGTIETANKAVGDSDGNSIIETYATKTENDETLTTAKAYTDTKISNLVGSAPDTLDTLEEIAKALDDNADIVDTIINKIPTKTSQLTNDSEYATESFVSEKLEGLPVSGHTHTTKDITDLTTFVKSGTGAKSGLVPAPSTTAGTTKYLREDGTWQVPTQNITVDSALSATSTNPLQNNVINTELEKKRPWQHCVVGQYGNTTANPFFKFASCSLPFKNYDANVTFKVIAGYGDKSTMLGILSAHVRTNSSGYYESSELVWEYAASGIDPAKYLLVHNTSAAPTCAELWVKVPVAYQMIHFEVMYMGIRNDYDPTLWTLYDATSGSATVTSGYTSHVSTTAALRNSTSGNASSASRTACWATNTMTQEGTWTCILTATLSSWHTSTITTRPVRFTLVGQIANRGDIGVYDVVFCSSKADDDVTITAFSANRLDNEDPKTDDVVVVVTSSKLEVWVKALESVTTTVWVSNFAYNTLSMCTDSSLRDIADISSRGVVYHPTSITMPTKLSQLTNDSGFITSSSTVNQARNVAAYIGNKFPSNKAGTWTCFAFWSISTSFASNTCSHTVRFTVYDVYEENGAYDVYLGLLKRNGTFTTVNFVVNRLDTDTTATENIVLVITSEKIEFWIKQLGTIASNICFTGLYAYSLNQCNDTSLAGLASIPSDRGTIYYPTSSATSASKDGEGNVIADTYATKTALPTKLSQLTNDAGYVKSNGTVSYSYVVYPSIIYGNANASNKKSGMWSKVCYWDIKTKFASAWTNRTVSFTLADLNVGQGAYEIFLSVRKNATEIAYVKLLADRIDTAEATTDKVAVIVTSTQVQLWMKADTTDYVKWVRLNNSGNEMSSYNGADEVTDDTGYEYLSELPTDRGTVYYAKSRHQLVEKAVADEAGNVIADTYATKASLPTKLSQLTNDSKYITANDTAAYAKATNVNSPLEITVSGNSGKYIKIGSWDYTTSEKTNFWSSFTIFDVNGGYYGKEVIISITLYAGAVHDAYIHSRPCSPRLNNSDIGYDADLALVVTDDDVGLWLKCPSYTTFDLSLVFFNQSGDVFARGDCTIADAPPSSKFYVETHDEPSVRTNTAQTISGSKTFSGKEYVTGTMQQKGASTDYSTYRFRNVAMGTSSTPIADADYGGSGSIYIQY